MNILSSGAPGVGFGDCSSGAGVADASPGKTGVAVGGVCSVISGSKALPVLLGVCSVTALLVTLTPCPRAHPDNNTKNSKVKVKIISFLIFFIAFPLVLNKYV